MSSLGWGTDEILSSHQVFGAGFETFNYIFLFFFVDISGKNLELQPRHVNAYLLRR